MTDDELDRIRAALETAAPSLFITENSDGRRLFTYVRQMRDMVIRCECGRDVRPTERRG